MSILTDATNRQFVDAEIAVAEENASYYVGMSDKIVNSYSGDLDRLMEKVKSECIDEEPSDNTLEANILELSNLLYFVGKSSESVGIMEDLAKLASKEAYNNSYLDNSAPTDAKKKPTVAELTAMAEDDSKYQNVINSIYARVYRQLKFKVDAAYEMLSSLRKVLSKRMQEMQLSAVRTSGGVTFGKEEF